MLLTVSVNVCYNGCSIERVLMNLLSIQNSDLKLDGLPTRYYYLLPTSSFPVSSSLKVRYFVPTTVS